MKMLCGGRGPAAIAVLVAVAIVVAMIVLGVVDGPAAGPSSVTAAGSTAPARAPATAPSCGVKPTIVLVHGAWADASSWSGEIDRLQRDGYVVRAIANPLRGLTSDAAEVADFLTTLSGPIVLDPDTLYDRVPYPGAPAGDTALSLKEQVFLQAFASDLPLWASQSPAAMSAFTTPSSAAAWQTVPSWYVIGTADTIITPEAQRVMAHRTHARILLVPGGSHLTLISHPEAVTNQILAAAQAACSSR